MPSRKKKKVVEQEDTNEEEMALDIAVPDSLKPGLSILGAIMEMVNRGDPVSTEVHQRLTSFMADLQPQIDLARLATIPLQISRLQRLHTLAAKAETQLERFLGKDRGLNAETLAKVLKVLYAEAGAISGVLQESGQKPPISNPDSMMRTVGSKGNTVEVETPIMNTDSRRRVRTLLAQFRHRAKQISEETDGE